jgi:hypothetical protein
MEVTDGETFGLETTSLNRVKGSQLGHTGVIMLMREDTGGPKRALAILHGW